MSGRNVSDTIKYFYINLETSFVHKDKFSHFKFVCQF